jgi:hypothetical protein
MPFDAAAAGGLELLHSFNRNALGERAGRAGGSAARCPAAI